MSSNEWNAPSGGDGDSGSPPPAYEVGRGNDGGDSATALGRGNPLCHADQSACYPDGNRPPGCGVDAGPPLTAPSNVSSAAPANGGACHVRETNGVPGTVCMPAGRGQNGAVCSHATDCGSGYECVGSPGRCRHYCCDGQNSCASGEFCDIQKATEQDKVNVPVCMAVRACDLLQPNILTCTADEDCSIVDGDGTTGCIAVGDAKVDESCDMTHCARGLACLGQSGLRTCYQLCEKDDPSVCRAGEKCLGTPPLFRDSSIGYCTKVNL